MSVRQDLISKHLADISAYTKHVLEAVERQREDASVKAMPEANTLVIEIERVMRTHLVALDELAEAYGAEGEGLLKQAVTAVAGVAAGVFGKLRESEVTRALRDDYTALALGSMGYTAMLSFGLAISEAPIAETAERHLRDLTPLQVAISKVIPITTLKELAALAEGEFMVNTAVDLEAIGRSQEAWAGL